MGWVKTAHGISGEIHLQLFSSEADWVDHVEALYLLPREKTALADLLGLKNMKLRAHKGGLIVRTPDIKDRTAAEKLKGYGVYVSEKTLVAPEGERIFLKQILDFDVVDTEDRVLGVVRTFSSNGPQDLLVVKTLDGKEALIPFVEDFIVEVDFKNQVLKMDLPPGLLAMEEK